MLLCRSAAPAAKSWSAFVSAQAFSRIDTLSSMWNPTHHGHNVDLIKTVLEIGLCNLYAGGGYEPVPREQSQCRDVGS
jgi:hypothetical protein